MFQKAVYLIHTAMKKSNLKCIILNNDVLVLCDCYLLQKTGSQEVSTEIQLTCLQAVSMKIIGLL